MRAGARARRGEQGHVVSARHQLVAQQRDHRLDAAVAGRRHGDPGRREHGDPKRAVRGTPDGGEGNGGGEGSGGRGRVHGGLESPLGGAVGGVGLRGHATRPRRADIRDLPWPLGGKLRRLLRGLPTSPKRAACPQGSSRVAKPGVPGPHGRSWARRRGAVANRLSADPVTIVPSLSMTLYRWCVRRMVPFSRQSSRPSLIYRDAGRPSKAFGGEWETRLDFLASTHEPLWTVPGGLRRDLGRRSPAGSRDANALQRPSCHPTVQKTDRLGGIRWLRRIRRARQARGCVPVPMDCRVDKFRRSSAAGCSRPRWKQLRKSATPG